MNKKLFSWKALAGVALLAAVSFTSCNSDTPIDSSNPSGVAPTTVAHQVGGDYDWTATVTSNAQLMEFFNADQKAIKDAVAKKTKISVCVNLNNYALDGKEFILPNPWGDADAKGKVINITVNGTFKNADFERADRMKKAADQKGLYPVVLNTKNLGGAEINFTLADQKFDLDLKSELTRSTFAGEYTIGWFKVAAQNDLSATEIKSGTVEAIDYESTGDVKGEIAAIWTKNAGAVVAPIAKMGAAGVEIGKYLSANNIIVEENATICNEYFTNTTKYAQLGTVTFKKAATVTLGTKAIAIEKILGTKAADCIVDIDGVTDPLKNVAALEKVTIKSKTVELTNDKFTDVIFVSPVTISTDKINTVENVTFNNLTIKVPADDQTITFNGVTFLNPVTMQSTMTVENTAEKTTYALYQWVIDEKDATKGKYVEYTEAKEIKEYNKGKEEKEYDGDIKGDLYSYVDANGVLLVYNGIYYAETKEANLIKIKKVVAAGTIVIKPENCQVILDGACQFGGKDKKNDSDLNTIWGNKGKATGAASSDPNAEEVAWYAVNYNENDYKWTPTYKNGVFQYYVLIKK